jgi:FixJ family two-component response regulator
MPAMTGLELQKRLLAQGNRMPIIFITAFPEPRIQRRAEAGGAVAFLEKPFDGAALVGFIHVAMRRGGVGTAE